MTKTQKEGIQSMYPEHEEGEIKSASKKTTTGMCRTTSTCVCCVLARTCAACQRIILHVYVMVFFVFRCVWSLHSSHPEIVHLHSRKPGLGFLCGW